MVVLTMPCTEFWDETSKSYSILNNAGAMVGIFDGYANLNMNSDVHIKVLPTHIINNNLVIDIIDHTNLYKSHY